MLFRSGKLKLDCASTEGANSVAADYSGSLALTRTSSVEGITDSASVVSLAALSSDGAVGALSKLTVPELAQEPMQAEHRAPQLVLKQQLELESELLPELTLKPDASSEVAKVQPQMLPSF